MATHIFTTNSGKILYNGIVVLGIMKFTYSSSTNSISIVNAHDTKDVLVRQAKVEDIEVNGSRYTSFEDLSSVLTELLFIDGRDDESKSGSENWSINGNEGTNPEANFIGTIDNKEMVLKTNNIVRVRYKPDGTIFYGEGQRTDGTIIVGYHNADKANPIYRFSSIIDAETSTTSATSAQLQIVIARRDRWAHKLAKKGDIQFLTSGSNNFILGSRTNVETEAEKVAIILAPASATGIYPFVVESQIGNQGYVGINTRYPTTYLEINGGSNKSGMKFTAFNSKTPSTKGAKPLGVTETGDLVTIDSTSLDTGWMDVTLNTGYSLTEMGENNQKPQYRKIDNKIVLRGSIYLQDERDDILTTLPEEYRPSKLVTLPIASGNDKPCRIIISPSGEIGLGDEYNWVSIDGVEFYIN